MSKNSKHKNLLKRVAGGTISSLNGIINNPLGYGYHDEQTYTTMKNNTLTNNRPDMVINFGSGASVSANNVNVTDTRVLNTEDKINYNLEVYDGSKV